MAAETWIRRPCERDCSSAPPPPSPAPPRAAGRSARPTVRQIRWFSPPYCSALCCYWCAERGQGGWEARAAPPSRCSAPAGRRPATGALRRCRAQQAVCSGLLCEQIVCLLPSALDRVVVGVVWLTGQKGEGKKTPSDRLVRTTTTSRKTRRRRRQCLSFLHHLKFNLDQIDDATLQAQLSMSGLTWPVLISTINSIFLLSSSLSSSWISVSSMLHPHEPLFLATGAAP